ncbi:hypothetical protein ACOTV8_05320 [Campylobacter jejuni]
MQGFILAMGGAMLTIIGGFWRVFLGVMCFWFMVVGFLFLFFVFFIYLSHEVLKNIYKKSL